MLLPTIPQVFAESPGAERYHSDIVTAIESQESSEIIVEQQSREYWARINEMRNTDYTADHNRPVGDRECEFCHHKGHLDSDHDRFGYLIVRKPFPSLPSPPSSFFFFLSSFRFLTMLLFSQCPAQRPLHAPDLANALTDQQMKALFGW